MYKITGQIEGIADLLFNSPGPIPQDDNIAPGKKPSKMSVSEARTHALERLHQDDMGIHLPPEAFMKVLTIGANRAGLKDGRRALSGLLEAAVFVHGKQYLGATKPDYIHEAWGRVPPRTGGMVVIRRPAFNAGWKADFSFTVTEDRIPENEIKLALETAGYLVGFCSHRPAYGRFKITDWQRN